MYFSSLIFAFYRSGSTSITAGAIAGAVIGSVVGVAVIGGILYYFFLNKAPYDTVDSKL